MISNYAMSVADMQKNGRVGAGRICPINIG